MGSEMCIRDSESTKLDLPFLGEIPLHMDIRETSDGGEPIVVSQPDSVHAESFRSIATQLWSTLEGDENGRRAAPNIVIQ